MPYRSVASLLIRGVPAVRKDAFCSFRGLHEQETRSTETIQIVYPEQPIETLR